MTVARLNEEFTTAAADNRAAFIGYLPVGYPDASRNDEAFRALAKYADVIEVGLPYSDPVIDGPVVQEATHQALTAGARTSDVFGAVTAVVESGAAAVVMSYWNLIDRYGVSEFAERLTASGGSGVITPDLIVDEASTWITETDKNDLGRIFLVAPSSTPERLAMTVQSCGGFVYAASTMGVTGARTEIDSAAKDLVARVREVTDLPVCVGLGVSTPEQAHEIAQYADGVIVGSALIRALRDGGVQQLEQLAAALAEGVRR